MSAPLIWWVRNDLRLADNPVLAAAASAGRPLLAVYILDEAAAGCWQPGGASRWWLHGSLEELGETLAALGIPLLLRRGAAPGVLAALAADIGSDQILAAASHEPWARQQEQATAHALGKLARLRLLPGNLLFDPATLRNRSDRPFRVFTPFWNACLVAPAPAVPRTIPPAVRGFSGHPPSESLADWALRPLEPDWAGGLRAVWQPGEAAAWAQWERFAAEALADYPAQRDRPGCQGTSRLSPHLHFGEISARTLWHATDQLAVAPAAKAAFLREIGWREFSAHLLWHWPSLPEQPLRRQFRDFPWRKDAPALAAWQRGRTGYPIVDAGMRELWASGWMHNRVRMITASFLVKDLLIHWRAGEAWFHDTLVDADLASNAASWQWVAGCGTDAAPWFRIFNPVLQGRKFDPEGDYVRRWVPELAGLPNRHLHAPWAAPGELLTAAGIRLGKDYPLPMLDHGQARQRALAAFAALGGG